MYLDYSVTDVPVCTPCCLTIVSADTRAAIARAASALPFWPARSSLEALGSQQTPSFA